VTSSWFFLSTPKECKFHARVTVLALPWQQAMSFGVKVIELGDRKSSKKKNG